MHRFNQSIFILLTTLLFTPVGFASEHGSFYVSANTGTFQADYNNTYLDQTDVIAQNIAGPTTQHGYTIGAAIGYSYFMTPLYFLSGELSGNIDGQNATFQSGASTTAFSDTIQINHHIDLTFRPGLMLTESVYTYIKLGISWAALKDNLTSPTGYSPTFVASNSSKTVTGFASGLGFGKNLTPHTALFVEGNYHDYGTVNFPSFQNFTATYTHSAHIYSYGAVIGLTYSY